MLITIMKMSNLVVLSHHTTKRKAQRFRYLPYETGAGKSFLSLMPVGLFGMSSDKLEQQGGGRPALRDGLSQLPLSLQR